MSMIPKETPATETPAAEGGADPKAAAPAAAPPAAPTTSSGVPSASAPVTAASPGAPAATPGSAPVADPKADFERKLSSLADLEMTVSQRAKAIEQLEAKYKGYEGLGAALPEGITADDLARALSKLREGDTGTFVKAMLRDKWNQEELIKLADTFDAEELPVEERVRRELAAEKKREQDAKDEEARKLAEAQAAAKKKADEDAIADASRQLAEATKTGGQWLAKNIEKYPLIAALDDDEDVDHEQMYRSRLIDYVEKNGNRIPTDEEGLQAMRTHIFDAIESGHRRKLERMNPKPKDMRQEMSEWDRVELLRLKGEERAAAAPVVPVKVGPKTGLEEALERMAREDREDQERAALSYGRR